MDAIQRASINGVFGQRWLRLGIGLTCWLVIGAQPTCVLAARPAAATANSAASNSTAPQASGSTMPQASGVDGSAAAGATPSSSSSTAGARTSSGQNSGAVKTGAASPGSAKSAKLKADAALVSGAVASQNSGDAKTDAAKPNDPNFSVDAVAARIKELEAASDADQPDRAVLLDLYRQALADLKKTDEQKSRTTKLEKERIAAPYQLEIRKRESAAKPSPQNAAPEVLPAAASLATWEQMLATTQQELETAQKTLDIKKKEEQRRAARRLEIPQTIAADRVKLDELQPSDADSSDAAADSAAVTQARHIARHARRLALTTEIALAEKELQVYDTEGTDLLSLECESAEHSIDELINRVTAWQAALDKRRDTEASEQASEAHWAAATAIPAVRELANENSTLADDRQHVTKAIEQLTGERTAVNDRLAKVSDQFKQATDKLSATGLTESIGQMLLKQRSELALLEADRHAVRLRQEEIAQVQLDLFDFQEQLDELHNLDTRSKEICISFPQGSEAKPEDIRRLLETKRKYLQALIEDDNSYFSALVEIDSQDRELLAKADNFRDYIDQRVLWIRSTHALSTIDGSKAASAVAWLVQPSSWWSAALELIDGIRSNILVSLLALAVFVPWIYGQRRLRAQIVQWGRATPTDGSSTGHSALRRACQTTAATLLIATLWPALAWFSGWLLVGSAAAHGEFPEALGAALQISSLVSLPLLLVRQICRHDGLAEAHFGWPSPLLLTFRRQLTWLALLGTPTMVMVTMLQAQSNDAWKDSLGRLAFIAGQLVVAGFVFSTLKPPLGVLHRLIALRSGTWTNRLALPIFVVLVTLPVALAVLAIAGYYYTALRLACRLQTSIWLILGLVTVHALAYIWLKGLHRRAGLKAARAANATGSVGGLAVSSATNSGNALATARQAAAATSPMFFVDQEKSNAQTHQLLHNLATIGFAVGLCLIWFDMFPALQFFGQVTLWPDMGSDPAHPVAITLANLLEAAVVVVLTIVAARNLPSLLEIAVQRLAPDHGVRYALVAVTRYSIVVVGLTLACSAIGIGWGKLQWLIAAMSFGLGFGLQEIFANFISGLIVLLERPIRIGDTVTVGDVTGTVSRIQMRATTIVDADRKELILPNKDLISGRLVNWTLTDSVIRLVVRLGVAYGSDTEQAQRLLLDVASKTPEVLRSPAPKAVFMGFGEKSLDFELRVFVGHVDSLLPVRHQLNMAIDRSFHAAGVELSFAQADTFIRHAEELHAQAVEKSKAA